MPRTLKITLVFFCALASLTSFTQTDSLFLKYRSAKTDSAKFDALTDLCSYYQRLNPDSAIFFGNKACRIAENAGDLKRLALGKRKTGTSYYFKGLPGQALRFHEESLGIALKINSKPDICAAYVNIGESYRQMADYPKALDYLYKGLKIAEDINKQDFIAGILNNIASIHYGLLDYEKALEFNKRALALREKLNMKNDKAASLSNIGILYEKMKQYDTALYYQVEAKKICEEQNDERTLGNVLGCIGNIFQSQKNFAKAVEYHGQALKICERINNKRGMGIAQLNMASDFHQIGVDGNAVFLCNQALLSIKGLGTPDIERDLHKMLYDIYSKQKNLPKLHFHFEKYIQLRDSIVSEEKKVEITKKDLKYQFDKKTAADSVKNAEEQKVKDALLLAKESTLKSEKTQRYALYGGLLLVLVFSGFLYNRFALTRRQNRIIEQQKLLVEVKNKEITDSIHYAKRIQSALLASANLLNSNLDEYFILYKPKDIVSGDFYWAGEIKKMREGKMIFEKGQSMPKQRNSFMIATADCTGHGVPGAFMSLLNISFLNEAVNEKKIISPDKVLNHIRTRIISALSTDGSTEGGKDGMDAVLCVIDTEKMELQFAGANNPLWIIRNNELLEYKSDKMPVGKSPKEETPFSLQTISLQKGDLVYTLTDGYADQFGGPRGKKFKYKQIQSLLLKHAGLSMSGQQKILESSIEDWKKASGKEIEQVDDILIIGLRI